MVDSFIPENYSAFCSASESNKRNARHRIVDLPFFFRYRHITALKNHLSLAQGESFSFWFHSNFCGRVCFVLPVERISFVCSC